MEELRKVFSWPPAVMENCEQPPSPVDGLVSRDDFLRSKREKEQLELNKLKESALKRIIKDINNGRTTSSSTVSKNVEVQAYIREQLSIKGWGIEFEETTHLRKEEKGPRTSQQVMRAKFTDLPPLDI